MKRVVVTGAAGFVGCNLVEHLLAKGYFVYAMVRKDSCHNMRLEGRKHVKLVFADLKYPERLLEEIPEPCESIVHLAWQGEDREDFVTQYANVDATLQILNVAKKLGCRRFLCAGSQAEYGVRQCVETEDLMPQPVSAYGASKVAACYLSRKRADQYDIEWVWARIFSVYGKYEPEGTMLSYLKRTLRAGASPKLSAATQNWDYINASDCAEALIALMERGHAGEIYNVANGDYRPLREFVEELREKIAPQVSVIYSSEPGVVSLQPSVEKIQKDTGWKAVYPRLWDENV